MVLNRSLGCSRARDAMIAGTEHPNPRSRGRKARPESPRRLIMSSITKATLAIYPLSSNKARARKRMKILGRKVRIPPTPEMIPSTIRDWSKGLTLSACRLLEVSSEICSNAISKYPFNQSPMVNVRKNTSAIIPRKMGRANHLCVRSRSILSVDSSFADLFTRISSMTSSIKSYFWLMMSFS